MRDGQYIKTLNTNETNRDELVKLMVGRELSDEYPKRNVEIGGEILRVEHLSTEATDIEDVSLLYGRERFSDLLVL